MTIWVQGIDGSILGLNPIGYNYLGSRYRWFHIRIEPNRSYLFGFKVDGFISYNMMHLFSFILWFHLVSLLVILVCLSSHTSVFSSRKIFSFLSYPNYFLSYSVAFFLSFFLFFFTPSLIHAGFSLPSLSFPSCAIFSPNLISFLSLQYHLCYTLPPLIFPFLLSSFLFFPICIFLQIRASLGKL